MALRKKIIIALDVKTEEQAVDLVKELKDYTGAFKIGLELFNSIGPRIIESVKDAGAERIFLDGKFHDIPNTVSGAARAAVRMGVWMFNIHVSGGFDMMESARLAAHEEAERLKIDPPLMIGVTVLTSIGQDTLHSQLKINSDLNDYVLHLAELARQAGLDGVIASAREAKRIKESCGSDFLVVTPGIRPSWASANDQIRIITPHEALENGSDYLIIGRAITSASNKVSAAEKIIAEIELAHP